MAWCDSPTLAVPPRVRATLSPHTQIQDICCSPLRDRRTGLVVGVLEAVFERPEPESESGDKSKRAADDAAAGDKIATRNEAWTGAFIPFLEVCGWHSRVTQARLVHDLM